MSSNESDVRKTLERLVEAVTSGARSAAPQGFAALEGRAEESALGASSLLAPLTEKASPQSGAAGIVGWLNPLAAGVMSLFGGGDSAEVERAPYVAPARQLYELGFSESAPGQLSAVDYSDRGTPRGTAASPGPQIVVQVQAMDSRSFLDHTGEIAQAVKRALLESNGLTDVMQEF